MADNTSGAGGDKESSDRPVVELFVKAAVDKMKTGGCPLCQRYFMVMYILREHGYIDLIVTTFLPETPPKEVLEISNGKHYPLIKVHHGIDPRKRDISGLECDTIDEIEHFVDYFNCDDNMRGRRDSKAEDQAEKAFEDLYKRFNLFLRNANNDPQSLNKVIERLDEYLRSNGTKFMVGDTLARADCYLLPILQHIRVAGKAYKSFEIPTEFSHVWRYLANAYQSDAFLESCPADREIITHYEGKASCRAQVPHHKSQLMGEDRTLSVPQGI